MASEPNFERLVAVMRRLRRGGDGYGTQEKPVTRSSRSTNCQVSPLDSLSATSTTRCDSSYPTAHATRSNALAPTPETANATPPR